MVYPMNYLVGTSKPEPNYNQIQLTTQKNLNNFWTNYKQTDKLNQKKLKPGLGTSYTIRPGNGMGLFYSSRTHKG